MAAKKTTWRIGDLSNTDKLDIIEQLTRGELVGFWHHGDDDDKKRGDLYAIGIRSGIEAIYSDLNGIYRTGSRPEPQPKFKIGDRVVVTKAGPSVKFPDSDVRWHPAVGNCGIVGHVAESAPEAEKYFLYDVCFLTTSWNALPIPIMVTVRFAEHCIKFKVPEPRVSDSKGVLPDAWG